jgi:hypothetical protein
MFGPGFVGAQFQPTHNLWEQWTRLQQMQSYQQMLSQAATADQSTYMRMLRGTAALAGVQWNLDRERSAQIMARDMTTISPVLGQMMPELFDQFHGIRGSAVVMGQGVFLGARSRFDPVTGLVGMSAESASRLNTEMFERLYGPGANLASMRGLGAGVMGQAYNELALRGLLPATLSRQDALRGMAREDLEARGFRGQRLERELGGAVAELERLGSAQLDQRLQSFDASRTATRLRQMAGAISAMRDIMGSEGMPNAPMAQLIEGIQALTQGGLNQMEPARVEQQLRQNYALARMAGMGLDQMMVLQGVGAQRADALGLNRAFVPQAAAGAMGFSIAYRNAFGSPAWGRISAERALALDQQLRLNAAASPVANQLAATFRLGQDVGFAPGSEAAAIYQALQERRTEYTFGGQTRSVYATGGDWLRIMQGGGVQGGLAAAYRNQFAGNQQFIAENNLMGVARNLQGRVDVAPRIIRAFAMEAANRDLGFTQAQQMQIATLAAEGLLGAGLTDENFADKTAIARFIGGRMGIGPDDPRFARLQQAVNLGWGRLEESAQRGGYGAANPMIAMHRPGALRRAEVAEQQAALEGRMNTALSGLGQGTPIRRVMDALLNAGPNTNLRDIIASTLGMVPTADVMAALGPRATELQREIEAFQRAGDNPEGIAMRNQAISRMRWLVPMLVGAANQGGLNRPLTQAQVNEANRNVLNEMFRTLGISPNLSPHDLESIGASAGMAGLRASMPALRRLRTLAMGRGALTADQFRQYLQAGPQEGATAEERDLFRQISGGVDVFGGSQRTTTEGIVGIASGVGTRASILSHLSAFAPARGPGQTGAMAGNYPTHWTGTFRMVTGQGGTQAHVNADMAGPNT